MEEIELGITIKEKLKYLYNILYRWLLEKPWFNFVLSSNPDEYLKTLKRIILARSNWNDSKEKDKNDNPMDIDCLRKRKRNPN